MARLAPCPSCHAHVLTGDRACPHCGAALRTSIGVAPRVATLAVGLTLTGCPQPEPAYGIPDWSGSSGDPTESTTASMDSTDGTTSSGTSSESSGGSSTDAASTSGTAGSDGSSSGGGEPAYGVPGTTSSG